MMSLAACLSCLAFFVKLVEDLLVGAIPDTFQDSVYRMKILFFLPFFAFPIIYIFIVTLITIPIICPLLWQSPSPSLLCFSLRGCGAPRYPQNWCINSLVS